VFVKILKWLLKMVDFDISLNGDLVTIVLTLGSVKVLDFTVDLIKDDKTTTGVRSVRSVKVPKK